MKSTKNLPEMPIIRPPSEWRSLLVRITRGCKWNRCRFCGLYTHLGQPEFSVRTVDEVKHDIDLLSRLRPSAETAFFGDADPLEIGVPAFSEIARYLHQTISIQRLTCYARASTLNKLGQNSIDELADAGLHRVHIGLESGDPVTLRFHRKGQSPKMIRNICAMLKKAGIEISFYVLLGLGGKDNWKQHILETAKVINETEPDFVRLRRLWLYGNGSGKEGAECPLWKNIRDGSFLPQSPEGTVLELRLLLEKLHPLKTFVACDHQNNYVHVSGILQNDKQDMLTEIDTFLALPERKREAHYQAVGSRI
jgi:hypothetical protein